MNKDKILTICKKIIYILIGIQIILGCIFIIKNIGYMPNYGDSKEFLEISQTMELDSYRPFVYPYILNISEKLASVLKTDIINIAYLIQCSINLFTSFVLIGTIKKLFNIKISKKESILYSLYIFFIPFNLHFNMSIKCDSLATSFTTLFLCYLIKYLKDKKCRFAIYTFITMFISCNIRSERIYFLSFVLVALIMIEIIMYFCKKRKQKLDAKKIITLATILILAIITTNISKAIFQDENSNDRSQPTISMYLYERIVGNTLPEIYQYLPEDIKQKISYEDAIQSSIDRNNYKLPYETLYEQEGNLESVNTIMKIAIRRNFPDIVTNIVGDFIKNMLSPYYLIMNENDWSGNYTKTRMEGEHYLFTDLYILYFNSIFIIINIYFIMNLINKNVKLNKSGEIIVIILYSVISSAFFAMLTSQNFHIRYVMPIYTLEIAIVAMLMNKIQELEK